MAIVFQKVEKLELPRTQGNIKYFSTDGSWPHFDWIGQKNAFHYTSHPVKAENFTEHFNDINLQTCFTRFKYIRDYQESINNYFTDNYPPYYADTNNLTPSTNALGLMEDVINHDTFFMATTVITRCLVHILIYPEGSESYFQELFDFITRISIGNPELRIKLENEIYTIISQVATEKDRQTRESIILKVINDLEIKSYELKENEKKNNLKTKFN